MAAGLRREWEDAPCVKACPLAFMRVCQTRGSAPTLSLTICNKRMPRSRGIQTEYAHFPASQPHLLCVLAFASERRSTTRLTIEPLLTVVPLSLDLKQASSGLLR